MKLCLPRLRGGSRRQAARQAPAGDLAHQAEHGQRHQTEDHHLEHFVEPGTDAWRETDPRMRTEVIGHRELAVEHIPEDPGPLLPGLDTKLAAPQLLASVVIPCQNVVLPTQRERQVRQRAAPRVPALRLPHSIIEGRRVFGWQHQAAGARIHQPYPARQCRARKRHAVHGHCPKAVADFACVVHVLQHVHPPDALGVALHSHGAQPQLPGRRGVGHAEGEDLVAHLATIRLLQQVQRGLQSCGRRQTVEGQAEDAVEVRVGKRRRDLEDLHKGHLLQRQVPQGQAVPRQEALALA
mmetsp:Transcript_31977/g.76221  ORF Transcript_31977/g.76221 Transcript_31977/m.76221 type:complete len:296 (-) Transcript_31977:580-1467(-)